MWSRDSSLARALDSRSKGCEFKPRQERRENFLLQSQLCVLTLIRCPFHSRVTAVARKKTGSFCKKCRQQVTPKHACTLYQSKSEWAGYAAVQAECGNLAGHELTRNSSGSIRIQSSQLDPGLKSEISLRELSPLKKKKKRRRRMICRTFSPNPRTRGKSHHHHHCVS